MKNEGMSVKRIYAFLYLALFLAVAVFIAVNTLPRDVGIDGRMTDFGDGWTLSDGEVKRISDISLADYTDGGVTVTKTLPWDITDEDSICFETKNLNISVYIYDREVYRFTSK